MPITPLPTQGTQTTTTGVGNAQWRDMLVEFIRYFQERPAPWARSITTGQPMPLFTGYGTGGLPAPLPSAAQWQAFNPLEQQAIFELFQSLGVPPEVLLDYLRKSFPEWGAIGRPLTIRPGF